MASKLLRDHRIKPKDQKRTNDVLALEKAAAWAWYQRSSSGSEGKSTTIREPHIITRTQLDHRPSRYKLEAMRMGSSSSSSQETKEEEGLSCPVHQHNSKKLLPLLDAYEVRSILTRLDSLIAESSSDDKLDNGRQRMKKNKKKKVGKGIWERRRVTVICSSRKEDVVEYGRKDSKEIHQIQLSASNKHSMPTRAINGGRLM